jgi:NADH:ubiquinone oxidoreductase subunit 5 (subunit L)/multisubunit Na+/H+ antiporter MnhA subunit
MDGSILGGLVLATVLLGVMLVLFWSWFAGFLAPAVTPAGVALSESRAGTGFPIWIVVSVGVAFAGWIFAYYSTQSPFRQRVSESAGRKTQLYVLFWNKLYVDEIYDAFVVDPTIRSAQRLSRLAETMKVPQMLDMLNRWVTVVEETLTALEPSLVGRNILVLIFGFVVTMSLLLL